MKHFIQEFILIVSQSFTKVEIERNTQKRKEKNILFSDIIEICPEIIEVQCYEPYNFIHSDLKHENIFIKNCVIKI